MTARQQRHAAALVEALRELQTHRPAINGWPARYICQRAGVRCGSHRPAMLALERDGHVVSWLDTSWPGGRRLYALGEVPYVSPPPGPWWRSFWPVVLVVILAAECVIGEWALWTGR